MLNKINLLFLLLYSHKRRNISIFAIATLLIALLSSVLFISSSIQKELQNSLQYQADFTVQKFVAGRVLNVPSSWIDEFLKIKGVTNVQGRVYGVHYYEPKETYFLIVGVDMYEKQVVNTLQKLIDSIDINDFLSKKNMLIGSGVKAFFDKYQYNSYYIFRPPDRSKEKVFIYDTLPKSTSLMSNDIILMDISLARKILGLKKDDFTDIVLEVENGAEMQKIEEKLIMSHFNTRIIKKSDIEKFYTNLFNYKGGIFLTLFLITLSTFLILLYQKYSIVSRVEAKEIALLRMLGWRIKNIIYLKIVENTILASTAYMLGIIFAYIYVFYFNAPLLKNIFLGFHNLTNDVTFSYYPNLEVLGLLYLFFIVPFILAILIPLYKISVTDISEIIK